MSAYRLADRACKATCEAICGRMSWLLACGLNPLVLSSWSCSPCLGFALLALRSSLRGLRFLSLSSSFRLDLSNLSPTQASLTARPLASMSRSWSWRRALGLAEKGRLEAKAVCRLAARASTPAQARADVLGYAMSLGEDSYLRMHCLDQQFSSDSHETEQGPRPRRRRGKHYQSGHQQRKSWGLKGWDFLRHKYGADVNANLRKSLATRTRANS
jgi:hypothetical protein